MSIEAAATPSVDARRLGQEGGKIVVADRVEEGAAQAVAELHDHGIDAMMALVDVGTYAGAQELKAVLQVRIGLGGKRLGHGALCRPGQRPRLVRVLIRRNRPRGHLGGARTRALELLHFVKLEGLRDEYAGNLSYGQQKLIDIAMAFMPAPRLVLLDEPCAGVNPSLVDQLRELLVELNRTQGGSFVVIEHNMDFIMKLCPHVICMVEGKVMAKGAPAEVQANRQVLDAYLGN